MTTAQQSPTQAPWEIQTYTLCYGWVNTWTYEDDQGIERPETFPTKDAAKAALAEYLEDLAEDNNLGNISDYNPSDFRVVQSLPGTANAVAGAP